MRIWIVRKHPKHPYERRGYLEAFTIHKAYTTRAEAKAEADKKQAKSNYLYTVGYVELKEMK